MDFQDELAIKVKVKLFFQTIQMLMDFIILYLISIQMLFSLFNRNSDFNFQINHCSTHSYQKELQKTNLKCMEIYPQFLFIFFVVCTTLHKLLLDKKSNLIFIIVRIILYSQFKFSSVNFSIFNPQCLQLFLVLNKISYKSFLTAKKFCFC